MTFFVDFVLGQMKCRHHPSAAGAILSNPAEVADFGCVRVTERKKETKKERKRRRKKERERKRKEKERERKKKERKTKKD